MRPWERTFPTFPSPLLPTGKKLKRKRRLSKKKTRDPLAGNASESSEREKGDKTRRRKVGRKWLRERARGLAPNIDEKRLALSIFFFCFSPSSPCAIFSRSRSRRLQQPREDERRRRGCRGTFSFSSLKVISRLSAWNDGKEGKKGEGPHTGFKEVNNNWSRHSAHH